ncbi:amidohydrolase family protein [Pedobacter sp. HMF7647]|uniref:Amidohydrolase family protein n=1 Tax=Hufsiella arboris TaxID=2695275 RepID=A0A7K1YCE0_9SPHI|nr:amidohydrolase family protein [Hufsiella arboris]MXV52253.1 amidohydrolase family protein [Hufsiella arboris]
MKIDAHQHFWKFDAVRDSWITDDMAIIRNDFLPADLEPLLNENGFDGCIVVQSSQSEEENLFQLGNAGQHEFIKGVVGWVDLQAEDIEDRLAHYRQFEKMKGFRHVLQGEADRALMLKPEFKRGLGMLNSFGFTYDILIFPDQLRYIQELVEFFPDQPFVIDHIAKPDIKRGKIDHWKDDIQAFASYENVSCKVSGMVTEANWHNWKNEDFYPYLDVIFETFGTERIMFGSDWPVCLVAATYASVVNIVQSYFSNLSPGEQEQIWGKNAANFYRLKS